MLVVTFELVYEIPLTKVPFIFLVAKTRNNC